MCEGSEINISHIHIHIHVNREGFKRVHIWFKRFKDASILV